jgi:UDP-N-acetylglucosamine--N-acetylmuramyl-(pentapeptide) pyrophosphoryl-undecaprenol N-acetylglucosamine transferase
MSRRPAVILHEQNAVLGRANRFLATRADRLALSFAATTRVPPATSTIVTGNPVRRPIASLDRAGYAAAGGKLRILVLGGSLGARVFSDVVPAALTQLPEWLRARVVVTQQCRTEDLQHVRSAYGGAAINAELSAFFPDVAARLVAAHLVIARAGASTVAELAVVGRPAVLVPLPGAIDDHQSANARALADAGGAWVMPQPTFTPDALSARLIELFTAPAALAGAAVGARSLAQPHAAARLADLVEAVMPQETARP